MRLLIADDHQFILESIEILISSWPEFEVVQTYNTAIDLLNGLEVHEGIDMVLTDFQMPQMTGIELTYNIRERYPHIKVLLLTVSEDADTIKEAFSAGVSGYLMKKAGKDEFKKAIDTIAAGQKYYSESVVFELLNRNLKMEELVVSNNKPELNMLSDREIEIIKLIGKELNTNEIAELLFLSPATVETHRHNIFKKLGIKNSIGLVKFAIKNGLTQ